MFYLLILELNYMYLFKTSDQYLLCYDAPENQKKSFRKKRHNLYLLFSFK